VHCTRQSTKTNTLHSNYDAAILLVWITRGHWSTISFHWVILCLIIVLNLAAPGNLESSTCVIWVFLLPSMSSGQTDRSFVPVTIHITFVWTKCRAPPQIRLRTYVPFGCCGTSKKLQITAFSLLYGKFWVWFDNVVKREASDLIT
jgi:hypothetical protein